MTSEDLFDSIERYFDDALPFVSYRKPNTLEVKALFQNDDTIYNVSDFTESGFVFAPFDDSEKAVLIPIEASEEFSVSVEVEDSKIEGASHSNQDGKDFYIKLVEKGVEVIKSERLSKVVLSRNETIEFPDLNFIQIFKRLLHTYPTAFVYCWYHPKIGLWLGATPETLLKVEGNRFSTMALAGTQKYNGTLDVVWQDKEKNEQQIVTNYIANSLKSSSNTLNISEVETVKAGNLLHLQTKIIGTSNSRFVNLQAILKALHPTPAVCGFPKDIAKQFILENENYNREYYAGFLGELNIKEKTNRNPKRRNVENSAYGTVKTVSNLYVNLRCVQLKETKALIYVGGGITKNSNPESEWQETVNKSQTIKKVL